MSLVLTQLSEAGVAMAADSAISYISNGNIQKQSMWRKLIRVSKINAGVSYWGSIGHLTTERFDDWLEWKISKGVYGDLRSFADWLAFELNQAAGQKLIQSNQAVGVHVAGITVWGDGKARPTFYHVHNGHLEAEVSIGASEEKGARSYMTASYPTGSIQTLEVSPLVLASLESDSHFTYRIKSQPRQQFSVNTDFAQESKSCSEADSALRNGFMIHNGDFVPFIGVSSTLKLADAVIAKFGPERNCIQSTQVGFHVGDLYRQLTHLIKLYRANGMARIVDGDVTTLGIRLDGSYLSDCEFKNSEVMRVPHL